ncbi:flippase [Haladaptatus sp. W1]|uniref:flippase n=1 Tax=Haladaptatus sp. W1 TaxID=1897478 RepID=UPI0009F6BB26|nr:flippase [Haladaptatus sp. W1]
MSGNNNIVSGAIVLMIGVVIELVLSFASKLVIARYIGRPDYGVVSLGISLLTMGGLVSMLGMNVGIARYLPRIESKAGKKGVLRSGLELSLLSSVILSSSIIIISNSFFQHAIHGELKQVLNICAIGIPLLVLMKMTIGGIQGTQKAVPKALIQNIVLPLTRFLLIGVALLFGLGSIGIASSYVVSYGIAAGVGLYFLWSLTPIFARQISFSSYRKKLFIFSAPLLVTSTMMALLIDIDTFLLGYYWSPNQVADYNIVYPLATLLQAPLMAFGFVFMPVISKLHSNNKYEKLKETYLDTSKWIMLVTLPLFLVLVSYPNLIITNTFGGKYLAGSPALIILSIGFYSNSVLGPNGNLVISIGDTKYIMISNLLATILNLILNVILIPIYNIEGAAIATTSSYVALNLLYSYKIFTDYRITSLTNQTILFQLFSIIIFIAISRWVTEPTVSGMLINLAVFSPLYGALMLNTNMLGRKEITIMKELYSRVELYVVNLL